jgi:hypothetical protein
MADMAFAANLGLGVGYTILCGILGMCLMGLAAFIIPKIVDRVTPDIDDEKELLRGNVAMGVYTGIITGAVILGIAIIVAASIIAGLM